MKSLDQMHPSCVSTWYKETKEEEEEEEEKDEEEEEDTSTGKWCSIGAAPAHEVTIWKHGLGAAGQLDTAGLLHRKLGNPEGYELDMHG